MDGSGFPDFCLWPCQFPDWETGLKALSFSGELAPSGGEYEVQPTWFTCPKPCNDSGNAWWVLPKFSKWSIPKCLILKFQSRRYWVPCLVSKNSQLEHFNHSMLQRFLNFDVPDNYQNSLLTQQLKVLVLSWLWLWLQLWRGVSPWPRNFCMPWKWQNKTKFNHFSIETNFCSTF